MRIQLTPGQAESLHLMYTNIANATMYAESLLSDEKLFKGIKEESVRPMYTKLKWLKTALELKMPRDRAEERAEKFNDTLLYDEVARLMAYMPYEGRLAVEEFAKSLIAEDV